MLPAVWSNDGNGPSCLEVVSTPFPRTVESVQALLLGLYPPRDRDEGATIPVTTATGLDMVPDHDEAPRSIAHASRTQTCPASTKQTLLTQLYR